MNEHKILFVICVNDEYLYNFAANYINSLNVPEAHIVELLPIYDAKSMSEGYNRALSHDAKYKVYLHQDVFILNQDFIKDILLLFRSNPQLGMIGLAGCKKMPLSGVWWEGFDLIGKVYTRPVNGQFGLLSMREIVGNIEIVDGIDGFLMATQYDIPWRDDLFSGFHFYDVSQSREFIKAGYLVGVPRQIHPWCLHFHKEVLEMKDYELYRQIFVQNYVPYE